MNDHDDPARCHVCAMRRDTPQNRVIFADGLWTAMGVRDIPGWIMLMANRHSAGWLWDLPAEEAASYGTRLRELTATLRAVCAPERVYLLALGENSPHFHCLLLPRFASTPEGWRGPGLLARGDELTDPAQAAALTARMRGHLHQEPR